MSLKQPGLSISQRIEPVTTNDDDDEEKTTNEGHQREEEHGDSDGDDPTVNGYLVFVGAGISHVFVHVPKGLPQKMLTPNMTRSKRRE